MLGSLAKKTEETEFYDSMPEGYEGGKTKYIVVTGSVISGVGKGTFSSCLGSMLKLFHGLDVVSIKFECYLNCDAGTLNPFRHGEVFVLDDGTESDLDLGTYERMLNKNLTGDSFITVGKVFKTIIDKERKGDYLGRDVEFVPHVTGEIKNFLRRLAMKTKADIIMVEIGGTVGEIQNSFYLEAMRELSYEEGKENVCFTNVTYVLEPGSLGEQKSKAAQLGIKNLMALGIQPDIIACRAENPIPDKIKEKISISANVPVSRIISMHNTKNIYKVPLLLKKDGIDKAIFEILDFKKETKPNGELKKWEELAKKVDNCKKEITVGIAGKYTNVYDSYISILKCLEYIGHMYDVRINVKWIDTTNLTEQNIDDELKGLNGIIVPGGFGKRGIEGKILCAKYARENNVPYLGLCLGLQVAVIEFARNVLGIKDAHSTEIMPNTANPVIHTMEEQKKIKGLGGSMRLGSYPAVLKKGSLIHSLYGKEEISERHRHRYEVNPDYIDRIEEKGLIFSGKSPDGFLMEFMELKGHKFMCSTQSHPEFTSKPLSPNPLFVGFVKACINGK